MGLRCLGCPRRDAAVSRSRLGRPVADLSRQRRARRALLASGLFDDQHYRQQLPALDHPDDLVGHYLSVGADLGLSPHPLFDREYYLSTNDFAHRSAADPFVEFVERGCLRGNDPHPLFDTVAYVTKRPEATTHQYGAFGHFVSQPDADWPFSDEIFPGERGVDRWTSYASRASEKHRAVPDETRFQRLFEDFDHSAAADFVKRMRSLVDTLNHHPTVSVILPTKDRLKLVGDAIHSVMAQTYNNWELIVVDDGGTDGTGAMVGELAQNDPRIRYVYQKNGGVSAARNHGLRVCSGDHVAYLDSDNTWVPEFLEVMVGFIASTGCRAAYCASELSDADRLMYRGANFNRERAT